MQNAVDSVHKKKLREECFETKSGITKAKTKTAFALERLSDDHYERKIMEPIEKLNRQEAKVLILARFHMLECGKNFKGSLPENCPECEVTDDEQHHLNFCTRYKDINFCNDVEKHSFDEIYESDFTVVKRAINRIERVWNLKTGHGSMVKAIDNIDEL